MEILIAFRISISEKAAAIDKIYILVWERLGWFCLRVAYFKLAISRPIWPQKPHVSSFLYKYHISIISLFLGSLRDHFSIGLILLFLKQPANLNGGPCILEENWCFCWFCSSCNFRNSEISTLIRDLSNRLNSELNIYKFLKKISKNCLFLVFGCILPPGMNAFLMVNLFKYRCRHQIHIFHFDNSLLWLIISHRKLKQDRLYTHFFCISRY